MRRVLLTTLFAAAAATASAQSPGDAMKLAVRPLLCVIDKDSSGCMMSFDIRWKTVLASEYCLNHDKQPGPLRCWATATAGEAKDRRLVNEAFIYWMGAPAGSERFAEVKIEVLRVGSADRRRERRTRHVWDVL